MAVKLKSGFEILRFSDLSFEGMTTLIQYKGEDIAQLNADQGWDDLEIELFTTFIDPDFKPTFLLTELLEAIEAAKKTLEEYKPA